MNTASLTALIKAQTTIEREGIFIAKEIAEKTVWDTLATENPIHAVISATDEASAIKKSAPQIADIMTHLQSTDVLLDLGAGYGRVAKYVLPEITLGGYIGVDSSYEMLTLFKRHYMLDESEQRTPLLLLNADIHTLPLQNSSVDVMIVCAVFLHNHKDVVKQAMTELQRVLKPGGKVLVYSSFPRAATAMGLQGLSYQALLNLTGRPFKNGPVRYYGKGEVTRLFAGFSELEIKPVGYSVLPKSLIFLPTPIDRFWRLGIANPLNALLERLTPTSLKPYFAVHFDIVAKK